MAEKNDNMNPLLTVKEKNKPEQEIKKAEGQKPDLEKPAPAVPENMEKSAFAKAWDEYNKTMNKGLEGSHDNDQSAALAFARLIELLFANLGIIIEAVKNPRGASELATNYYNSVKEGIVNDIEKYKKMLTPDVIDKANNIVQKLDDVQKLSSNPILTAHEKFKSEKEPLQKKPENTAPEITADKSTTRKRSNTL